jgi:hypothetical protein
MRERQRRPRLLMDARAFHKQAERERGTSAFRRHLLRGAVA